MVFSELKEKALSLPMVPGVYIMRDKNDTVIYVGKAKKLKNRVTQYFQDIESQSPKTRVMVSKIDHFDVIIAASEFEALVLECSLIKRYLPKYNILLKDDKGYPYVRLSVYEEYPTISMVSKIVDDGAEYYGPFGSRGVTQNIIDAICTALKLPKCNKHFPRDIGKDRPCLNYHMNQCAGWCQKSCCSDYRETIETARQLLAGNFKKIVAAIQFEMNEAADNLNFELAASLRDKMHAIEALGQKQLVTAGTLADTDVIGFGQTATKACFTVLHFSAGNLLDKDYEVLSYQENPEVAVSSLMKQYYLTRGFAPKQILIPFPVEDSMLFERMLEENLSRRTKIRYPQRGDNVRLVELANTNAQEEAQRITSKEEQANGTLVALGKMLAIDAPHRIESFDVSNISGTDNVGCMVVFCDGRPKRSEYKKFKIDGLQHADDYTSMQQMLLRRFTRLVNGDSKFNIAPDLLLIDGGTVHAALACEVLSQLGLEIPVVGMVKDDRHRTRALVTASGMEIAIVGNQAIFALIGNIQEETHRFAVSYHKDLRSKRLRYSELDTISGVGPKRKELLLKTFKSLTGIAAASLSELERILPVDAAKAVYDHFHVMTEGKD